MYEMLICMSAWLDECMRNDSKRFSKFIYTADPGFITYNHTVMHSYFNSADIYNINR